MRIGFFGGSFDPPHNGHLAVAQAAAQAFSLDRILLAPTATQPLKPAGPHAPFADRLAMVTLLCQASPLLEPSTLDAPLPTGTPNYTIDTLTRLRSQISNSDISSAEVSSPGQLFVIVGIDAFLDIPRWREPTKLLEIAEWIVVSRPGLDMNDLAGLELIAQQRAHVHLLNGVAHPASATEIRTRLHAHQDCSHLLPTNVLSYIQKHHLYRS